MTSFPLDCRLLFESHPLPMWVYDVETLGFLAVNDAAVLQYGYTRDEFLAMTIKDIRPPEDVPALLAVVADLGDGSHVAGPWRHRRKDGTVFEAEVASQAVSWGGRRARLVVGQDVTGRTRVQQSLLAHEERYRTILATIEEGYYEVDLAGKLTFANDALARILGHPAAEVIGLEHWQYTDLDNAQRVFEAFNRVYTTGQPARAQAWEIIRKDGSRRAVEASIQLVHGPMGEPVGFRGIVRDVTQRQRIEQALRESEVHYRSLVEHAPFGIYRTTVEGGFVAVNPALVEMLGYDSADELLAADLAADIYLDPSERARRIGDYRRTQSLRNVETRWKRKDGTPIWVRLNGRGVWDAEGNLEGFEVIVEDVTERRALEDQLRLTQRLEAVGRLAGGVAHDFGNLITAIVGYCDLVLRALAPDDPRRADIEEIRKTAQRGGTLTRQLLAYSRRQVLAPQVLDLHEVLADMGNLLRQALGEDVRLVAASQPGVAVVRADRGGLEQVLMNLALNARDAMPRGGRLTLEISRVTLDAAYGRLHANLPPGDYALLAVSDTGIGMDAETRSHAFEPFFTTKPLGQGTGLGLATVYGIVKQSGGYIWVYSEPGLGTTFKIYLPLASGEPTAAGPRAGEEAPAVRGSETILLVEDEPAVRAPVKELLEDAGFRVLEAADARAALALVERDPDLAIHVLVTDVVMPGMKGHELAQRFRERRPGALVLFTSGYSPQALAGELPPGAAFLAKPFTPEALARKVRELLDRPPA
ncbi:MAG TPA: PAS domain S-box protein [Gemmatimonadales bacterium]|nr:PAS domain S-box protein [Gemmatimonadales bacterium]